ncbi:putative tRNA sulfurtransferase [Labeo rohita]|uniref:tRNA sulfurtransferase n=1 Tax=Labeo rohita TaxID=84645 RepID=A0ABQ8MWL4_LABRO|nr:putative tRNA sulfurtransferase [Labeo rohita]
MESLRVIAKWSAEDRLGDRARHVTRCESQQHCTQRRNLQWSVRMLRKAPPAAPLLRPLCSPSAYHRYRGLVVGLPVFISIMAGGSLVSAYFLQVPDSALELRPSVSTSAPSSLISTVTRRPTRSTGLPNPSGSALVSRRPALLGSSLPPAPPPWTLSTVFLPGVRSLPEPPPALTSCCHHTSALLSTS